MQKVQNKVSRELAKVIDSSNGRFFHVKFVKKNGEVRDMTARLGVKKHLRGGAKTVSEDEYVTVFEPSTQSYKNINRDTILEVNFNGITFTPSK